MKKYLITVLYDKNAIAIKMKKKKNNKFNWATLSLIMDWGTLIRLIKIKKFNF